MSDHFFDLSDRTAVVTGGGTGLGRATVDVLARAGANVVIAAPQTDLIERVAEELRSSGAEALAVPTDVRDSAGVEAMAARAADRFGSVDVLVNNAAIYPSRPWHEVTEEEWDEVIAVNLKGCFLCARAVYPYMKARGWGRIVNIASITFLLGFPLLIHYVSSKGGIVGFTRALAREVGPDSVTVNCIAPGAFPTAAEEIHPDPEGYTRYVLENQCLKRRGRPEDIGHAVLFLASDAASFITGQTIAVDGGWAMH
jgi:NAD(P)-dependent dehydrogenase (short-subunit alcohol dehydrogenase family)